MESINMPKKAFITSFIAGFGFGLSFTLGLLYAKVSLLFLLFIPLGVFIWALMFKIQFGRWNFWRLKK
jgi:hypothetical protein